MAIISRAIPTLLRGISQSSDALKQSDHADIQDNADSNPVLGLTKRSGLQYLANIINGDLGNVHIQTINRDANEQYIAVFSNGNVRVFELDGNELTVHKPDGTNYLSTTDSQNVIKTVTIADFTFVVNTNFEISMDASLSGGTGTKAIIFIKQATANTVYSVTVDGVNVSDNTAGDSTLSTTQIASDIKTGLDAGLTGFTILQNGPVLYIRKNDNSTFGIDGNDSQGNSKMTIIKDSVQQFTDLPNRSPNGYVVEIKGDQSTNFDNYYVKFVTNNGGAFEEGQWEETVQAGIPFKLNYSSMPHVLIRQADGNFRFARVDGDSYTASGQSFNLPLWGERTVGDLISAPNPSFVGKKINNVFFFRNRLGFLAGDNVILSRVSDFFNFFPETVISVLDSEPIDVAASHTKVAILKNAVTIGEKLILFSDQTQFVLTSSADNLTPKTANVLVATEFESSSAAPPVGSGSSIYFLTQKGSFAGVREYIIQSAEIPIRDAANITIHVPRLILPNIFKMVVSTNQDILVLLGGDQGNKLYVYRWLYGGDGTKALSSWFTYTFNSNRTIKNIDFIGTDLFCVVQEASKATLEKIPFETEFKEPNANFQFHLDHKVTEATTGVSTSYNSTTGLTTFTVPYRLRANMNIVGRYLSNGETSTFVDNQGNTKNLKPSQLLTTTNATDGSTSTITALGNYTNSKFIIGEPYEMHYRFSQQRLTEGGGGTPEQLSGRLQLHHFYIKYEDAGFFKVEVTPQNRDTSTHEFTGRLLGSASAAIGEINLDTGTFKVPIMSKSDRVNIDIKNDTFLPTRLASAEYEGIFHIRSRRV
tara:strand:- start:194 stop:2647 length:2454 start_codon:yes stop_codon:yes gene_type:complete